MSASAINVFAKLGTVYFWHFRFVKHISKCVFKSDNKIHKVYYELMILEKVIWSIFAAKSELQKQTRFTVNIPTKCNHTKLY